MNELLCMFKTYVLTCLSVFPQPTTSGRWNGTVRILPAQVSFKTHSNIGDAQTFALLIAAGDHVSGQSRQAFGVCCSLPDLKAVRPQT